MRRAFARVGLGVGVLALLAIVGVGAADPPKVQFSDTRLQNGLRVIISEDHTAPVFSIAVTYNVGSRDERPGRTGFAHLFEHMMFKGSQNVGSGEHFLLVFNNGGDMNGSTSKDRTNYYERMPANQLDLALFLEADRMRALDINKANLDNQIGTVSEERKQGVDNRPYGRTFEAIDDLAYTNFNYRHSVIGSLDDLAAATVDDVAQFFKTYYAPNNAVLAIVGDVKTEEALAKVRRYFEPIPSQPPPPAPDMTEKPQTAEKRQTIDDPLARLARVDIVYHIPPSLTADADALSVLATILSSGRSSRFFENIVRQKQLSQGVSASAGESRGPGLFRVGGMVMPGKPVADLEQAIYEEVDRVKTGAIEPWEIEKARNNAKRGFVSTLTSSLSRAVMLSQLAVFYDDPNLINTRYERLSGITAADVQRVAKQYLTVENRTVVITNPKPAAAGPGAAKGGL
ncbi:MAG TPA: pitrilysin family protein [Vicinamibacterales bacterium]|nr:pitrilysin family protein [Vicinamibacterales bacterium]